MLGYDFLVEYKKGSENKAVDALSRKDIEMEGRLMLLTFPSIGWVEELKVVCTQDDHNQGLVQQFQDQKLNQDYTTKEWLLLYKQRLYILQSEEFRKKFLELTYNGPWGRHSRYDK